MPNYTIHIHQGSHSNSQPVCLPDVDAARREAIAIFAELARDIANKLPRQPLADRGRRTSGSDRF
jgi:hypothetical protein